MNLAVDVAGVLMSSSVAWLGSQFPGIEVGDSIHTESSRKYDAQSFTSLAELDGWEVAEVWTDAERLFAVFGLVAAEPAQGS